LIYFDTVIILPEIFALRPIGFLALLVAPEVTAVKVGQDLIVVVLAFVAVIVVTITIAPVATGVEPVVL